MNDEPGDPMSAGVAKPALLALALLLAGCGGGGGGGATPGETPLAAGDYRLVFSLAPAAGPGPSATSLVNGVDLAVTLPAGVSVATSVDGGNRIASAALSAGTGIQGTSMITGQYLAGQRQAHLSLTVAPTAAWSGDFAVLTVTIPAGASVPESALRQSVAAGLGNCTVLGMDSASHDSATLTGTLTAAMSISRP
jgi:hypothetical protein